VCERVSNKGLLDTVGIAKNDIENCLGNLRGWRGVEIIVDAPESGAEIVSFLKTLFYNRFCKRVEGVDGLSGLQSWRSM
jgi:hypothetical protein